MQLSHTVIEIKKSPQKGACYGDLLFKILSTYVIESCLGESKITGLGPKEIFDFQILLALYLYFITLSLYSTIKSIWNLFPIFSRIHDLNMLINPEC